jgi:hypothetical protein
MATPFNDQRPLDRVRRPSGLEHAGARADFDEEGFALAQTRVQAVDHSDEVLAALVKHPRWVDRDM